jgi:hypothetical protein
MYTGPRTGFWDQVRNCQKNLREGLIPNISETDCRQNLVWLSGWLRKRETPECLEGFRRYFQLVSNFRPTTGLTQEDLDAFLTLRLAAIELLAGVQTIVEVLDQAPDQLRAQVERMYVLLGLKEGIENLPQRVLRTGIQDNLFVGTYSQAGWL